MKTLDQHEYEQAWEAGYNKTEVNPFYSSSNMSDAFMIGACCKDLGFPPNSKTWLKKSRGSTWLMGATKFKVDGNKMTVGIVSSHPTY